MSSSRHRSLSGSQVNLSESDVSQIVEYVMSPERSQSITSDHHSGRTSISSSSRDVGRERSNSQYSHPAGKSSSSGRRLTSSSKEGPNGSKRELDGNTSLDYHHNTRRISGDLKEKPSSQRSSERERKRRASSPAPSHTPSSKRSREDKGSSSSFGAGEWKKNIIFERLGSTESPSPCSRKRTQSRCDSSLASPSDRSQQSPPSSQFSSPGRPYSRTSSTTRDRKCDESPTKSRRSSQHRETQKDHDGEKETERRGESERESPDRQREERRKRGREKRSREDDGSDTESDTEGGVRSGARGQESREGERDDEKAQQSTHEKESAVKSEWDDKGICNISWDEAETETADETETEAPEMKRSRRVTAPTTQDDTKKVTKDKVVVKTEDGSHTDTVKEESKDDGGKDEEEMAEVSNSAAAAAKEKKEEEKEHERKESQTETETVSSATTAATTDAKQVQKKRRKRKKEPSQPGGADTGREKEKKASSSSAEVKKPEGVDISQASTVTPAAETQASQAAVYPPSQQQETVEFPSRDYTERDVTPPLEVLQSMQNSYQQPFFHPPPVPFSSPASLAAFHQHLLASSQTALSTSSSLPFPLAPQTGVMAPQAGIVAPQFGVIAPQTGIVAPQFGVMTPQPVVTSHGVWHMPMPAQWQQFWMENQRLMGRPGVTAPPPPPPPPPSSSVGPSISSGSTGQVATGSSSQPITSQQQTPAGTVITCETETSTTGASVPKKPERDGDGESSISPQPAPQETDTSLRTVATMTQGPSSELVQHVDRGTNTAALDGSAKSTQTSTKRQAQTTSTEREDVKSGAAVSVTSEEAAPGRLSIETLVRGQSRRFLPPVSGGRRRKMDASCRFQYREMMEEFRSHSAMLATSTKIMIK